MEYWTSALSSVGTYIAGQPSNDTDEPVSFKDIDEGLPPNPPKSPNAEREYVDSLSPSFLQVPLDGDSTETFLSESDGEWAVVANVKVDILPDNVVPFAVAEARCKINIEKWLKSHWFTPIDFNEQVTVQDLRRVYVPFWRFKIRSTNQYVATITVKDAQGERKEDVSGDYSRVHDEALACANKSINLLHLQNLILTKNAFHYEISTRILPSAVQHFSLHDHENDELLDVEVTESAAFDFKKRLISLIEKRDVGSQIRKLHSCSAVSGIEIGTECTAVESYLVLLPVFMANYKYKGVLREMLVSGFSGAVVGARPNFGAGVVGRVAKGTGDFLQKQYKSFSSVVQNNF